MSRLIIDLQGPEVTEEEEALLQEPLIGGVILFDHNIIDPEQVQHLTQQIRAINPQLVIMVDQEGGRVQRLKQGWTHLPAMRQLGQLYDQDSNQALNSAEKLGWLLATEVLAVGIDVSLAPVLDIDHGICHVIGERALHHHPEVVRQLAHNFILGMQQAGMTGVAKHFPGHGGVKVDSHQATPIDERSFAQLMYDDFIPFRYVIDQGMQALMPAHIQFPQIDSELVTFSKIWLKDILRGELDYRGLIISDDIMMGAARDQYPDPIQRVRRAFQAGCDGVCVCHHREVVYRLLDELAPELSLNTANPLLNLRGKPKIAWDDLSQDQRWQQAQQVIDEINAAS